ncbi:ribonuclease H-like domain-containing protein [Phyllosticta paracitricarpa]|uniref:ribonuclease H n=1 Tax=Phyllosticta paracitricarpa TaxID=2016321 RepID=A0ABR1N0P2_9PEZI
MLLSGFAHVVQKPVYEIPPRLFQPSAEAALLIPTERIRACPDCGLFFHHCSLHPDAICHHRSVVFTAGACSNNGQRGASGGYGVAVGVGKDQQRSHPFCYAIPKTNQRAELMGAVEGIDEGVDWWRRERAHQRESGVRGHEGKEVIVATDSEYVVKGVTEWLPQWKENEMKTSNGTAPVNIDLFLQIESRIQRMDGLTVVIRFMHIPREKNGLADMLAKQAAELDSQGIWNTEGVAVHGMPAFTEF